MGLKINIQNKVKEIEGESFQVEEVYSVPTISNSKLTFGCKGLEFDATVLYIDMRGSTAILNKHTKKSGSQDTYVILPCHSENCKRDWW